MLVSINTKSLKEGEKLMISKYDFYAFIGKLIDYNQSIMSLSEQLNVNIDEGLIGDMLNSIGEILIEATNPGLEFQDKSYFLEELWRIVLEGDSDRAILEPFYNSIISGEVPAWYTDKYF